ncbi:hypothetical protein EDC96DRAFT_544339 [Choanephora cucurbitarum]|nr:hypothetical protein EDC96DRAFT_544339 [Choanephora cucurbitarum]
MCSKDLFLDIHRLLLGKGIRIICSFNFDIIKVYTSIFVNAFELKPFLFAKSAYLGIRVSVAVLKTNCLFTISIPVKPSNDAKLFFMFLFQTVFLNGILAMSQMFDLELP